MSFFAWGRLAYNPQLPEATIVAACRRRFGPAGAEFTRSCKPAARLCRWRWPTASKVPITGIIRRKRRSAIRWRNGGVLEFAENKPMDSRNFVGIKEFVAGKIAHKADGRIGPEQVACLLSAAAAQTRQIAAGIQLSPGRPADEWRLLKTDVLAAAALGEYYAGASAARCTWPTRSRLAVRPIIRRP